MSSFEEEESDWNSSNIKGFSFGDDEETPWEELSRYQSISGGASTSSSSSDVGLITFDSGKAAVVSDKVKKATRIYTESVARLDGLSISDVVGSNVTASSTDSALPTDPRELRIELNKARRQISVLEQARFQPLHPRETVHNIFLGKKFTLELYKSFQDKKDLIDQALRLKDGDAILVVSLFLRRTLNNSKFLELMSTRPVAVKHLANYFESTSKLSDLSDLLTSLGQHERAAVIQYKQACKTDSLEQRTRKIKSLLQNHFHGHPDSYLLLEHLHLLERISPVIAVDSQVSEITEDPHFPRINPKNETVLKTLLYFCYHHYEKGENLLQSPIALRKMHKLTESQFTWTALTARAKRSHWKDCQDLTLTKGWLGGKKAKSAIDPSGVVKILKNAHAPKDILQQFLQLVEDVDDKEDLARRCEVANVVIDCLVQKRDRIALARYRDRLQDKSQEWFYAEHAINMSNTKWKN